MYIFACRKSRGFEVCVGKRTELIQIMFWCHAIIQVLLLASYGFCIRRTEFLHSLLKDYDSDISPDYDNDSPTKVRVGVHINSLDSIDENAMEYSLVIHLIQRWDDRRLAFHNLIDVDYLELDAKLSDRVWVPDLYFCNGKTAAFHDVTVPNKMFHLFSNGSVVYKARISITAACPMDLRYYPMDVQICFLHLKSFTYSNKTLKFEWNDKPITLNHDFVLPNFDLVQTLAHSCSKPQQDEHFTCLEVEFHLKRQLGFYIIHIFIPSTFIVSLSWVSFWLNIDAVPARISLGILTILTMTTQKSYAITSLPKVSYLKAFDIWMAMCLCFVFAALLEFAFVNVLDRRQIQNIDSFSTYTANKATKADVSPQTQNEWIADPRSKKMARKVDCACRILFPGIFVLLCAVYWAVYG